MIAKAWLWRAVVAGLSASGVMLVIVFNHSQAAAANNPKTIYGTDSRTEQYQVSDPNWLNVGQATVMLVDRSLITKRGSSYVMDGTTYNEYVQATYGVPLCSGVPFGSEPAPGRCSGFLVGPDIVATAGHCVITDCGSNAFVFGFAETAPGSAALTVPSSDVYFCKGLIGVQQDDVTGADWALVRLDRPVTGHTPLAVRTEGKVPDSAQLLMAGYPYGLPVKYVPDVKINNNAPADYFEANPDALGGNSGSALVNMQTWQVEGILIAGNEDFNVGQTCVSEVHLPDSGDPTNGSEQVSRATIWSGMLNGGPLPAGATSDPNAGTSGAPSTGFSLCGPVGSTTMLTIALGLMLMRGRRWGR